MVWKKDQRLIEPRHAVREQARAGLRLKHLLLEEQARRKVVRNRGQAASKRRDRRLIGTGEASFEAPWREPTDTHPAARVEQDDAFSIRVSDDGHRHMAHRRQRQARAAYWTKLGAPPQCQPGDRIGAAIFHRRIIGVIEHGGWSHNEQTALADMEQKWGRRARGEDVRFMLAGNRPGRLHRGIERRIKALKEREG